MMQLLLSFLREFHARIEFQRPATLRYVRISISAAIIVLTCSYMPFMQPIVLPGAAKQQLSINRKGILFSEMKENMHAFTQNHMLIKDTSITEGVMLMRGSDCYTCHGDNKVLTAPSFTEIAEKYKNDKSAPARLVNKIIEGGKGQWGDKLMNPHPELLREDAYKMIAYILHLRAKKDSAELPAKSQ